MILEFFSNKITAVIGFVVTIVLLIFSVSLYTVDQRSYAIVFQFGEAVKVIDTPGLKVKIPFIQNVEYFDKRILNVDVEAKELTASDGKRLIVDAFAKFLIKDPVKFYKTVSNYQGIKIRLNKILESSMRQVIGRSPLVLLLSSERSDVMSQIHNVVNREASVFGVSIMDVRIIRADLPEENSAAIYKRMETERDAEAKKIRAEGEEEASKIRSMADKEVKVIIADAYAQSQHIRGRGDGVAAKIYNDAFSRDPDFYRFYKTLDTYSKSLKDNTFFIINPSSDFLKYLNIN